MKFAIMKDTKENSDCDWLQREYDEVNRTLLYVSAVVAQDRFEILPHSATIILDTITTMFNHFRTCPDITESSRMTSCQANVYQSLARFIHCTDSLLVSEPTSLDRDSAASVIGPLSSGIKELIQVWHHKKTGQKVSKPMTPHSQTNAFTLSNDCYGRTPLPDIPLTPREQQILVQTSMLDGCFDNNADRSRLHGKDGEDCDVFLFDVAHTERAVLASPPPKPPLPYHSNSVLPRSFQGGCLPSGPSEYINSAVGIVPPPLPAKQRLAQCRIDMSGAKSPATLSNREMDSSLMMSPTSMPISTHQTPDIAHTRSSSSGAPYYGSNPLAGMACVSCEQDSPLFPLTTASCFIGSHPTTVVPSCSKVPINTMSIPPIFNWTEEQTATVAGLSSNASYFSNAFSEPVAVIRKLNGSISENCLKISEITRSTSSTYNSCDNTPPPLPEKKFLLRRLMSQYDNVLGSSADAVVSSSMHEATPDSFVLSRPISPTPSSSSIFQASISSGSVPACVEGQTSCNHGNICLRSNNTCPSSSSCTYPPICLPQSPPPLPPKQRHVHAYMQTFGSMSHPISTVSSMSRQSIIFYETQWHRHETELKQHQCPQSHTVSVLHDIHRMHTSGISGCNDCYHDNSSNKSSVLQNTKLPFSVDDSDVIFG